MSLASPALNAILRRIQRTDFTGLSDVDRMIDDANLDDKERKVAKATIKDRREYLARGVHA
jgi:hypothetical protein